MSSRSYAQRTFHAHLARGELDGVITHPIFAGLGELRRFRLWNGGQSFIWADHMRDPFAQRASRGLNVFHSGDNLMIKFINGEFWGFTSMREHTSNAEFAAAMAGISRDNAAVVDRRWLAPYGLAPYWAAAEPETDGRRNRAGGVLPTDGILFDYVQAGGDLAWELYDELLEFAMAHDMAADYARERLFSEFFCQDNFMDYLISNTFFDNIDWPYNNVRFFRAITPGPGGKYNDGRWRFVLHDMDFIADMRRPVSGSRFGVLYELPDIAPRFNRVFLVFNNRIFAEQFVERALYVLENDFRMDRLTAIHDEFLALYEPLLPEMYGRFAVHGTVEASLENFYAHRDQLRDFLENRAYYYRQQLRHLVERLENEGGG